MGTKVQGTVNIQGRYTFPPQIKRKTQKCEYTVQMLLSHMKKTDHIRLSWWSQCRGPIPASTPGQETRSHTLQLSPGVLRSGAATAETWCRHGWDLVQPRLRPGTGTAETWCSQIYKHLKNRSHRTSLHCRWERKLLGPLWRTIRRFLQQLWRKLSYDPAAPWLGLHPEKTTIWKGHMYPTVCGSAVHNSRDLEGA